MVLKNYINNVLNDKEGNKIPLTRPKGVSPDQWKVATDIYRSAKRQGDQYPELTVAQAALESAWFKKVSGKNNFFGQKASKSQRGTLVNTKEVANNKTYKTQARFRDYDTIDESMQDRVSKWGSKYNSAPNVEEALYKIWQYDSKTGKGKGYATDDKYDVKIKKILGMIGMSVGNNTSKKEPSLKTPSINNKEIKSITQDSLNPNYYMEDLFNDSIDKKQPQQISEIKQQFEKEVSKKQNEKNFIEELRKMSFQTPEQLKQELPEEIQNDDYLYNYINLETYQDGGKK